MRRTWIIAAVFLALLAAIVAMIVSRGSGGKAPEGDGKPTPVENPDRMVSISGTIQLEDYESFGDNEHASGSFNKIVFVGNAQPAALDGTTMAKSFTMWNTSEEEPDDRADITLTVYNGVAP